MKNEGILRLRDDFKLLFAQFAGQRRSNISAKVTLHKLQLTLSAMADLHNQTRQYARQN
jgi:hypothetical protein